MNNHKKYLEEIDNESFANTVLGKLGEKSNWNPIQAVVNTGNLTAIKFVKKIFKNVIDNNDVLTDYHECLTVKIFPDNPLFKKLKPLCFNN